MRLIAWGVALALIAGGVLIGTALFLPWRYHGSSWGYVSLQCGVVFVGDTVPLRATVSGSGWNPWQYDNDLPWPFYLHFKWQVFGPDVQLGQNEGLTRIAFPPRPEPHASALAQALARRSGGGATVSARGEITGQSPGLVVVQVREGRRTAAHECFIAPPPRQVAVTPDSIIIQGNTPVEVSLTVEPAPDTPLHFLIEPLLTPQSLSDGRHVAAQRFVRVTPLTWRSQVFASRPGRYHVEARFGSRRMPIAVVVH